MSAPAGPSRLDVRPRLRFGVAAGVTALAAVLFVMPRYSLPDPGTTLVWRLPSGPTVHVVLCGVVAFLWVRAFSNTRPSRLLAWAVLFAVCAEALQLLPFVDRGVTVEDAGTNVLGVGLGWLLVMAVRWLRSSSTGLPDQKERGHYDPIDEREAVEPSHLPAECQQQGKSPAAGQVASGRTSADAPIMTKTSSQRMLELHGVDCGRDRVVPTCARTTASLSGLDLTGALSLRGRRMHGGGTTPLPRSSCSPELAPGSTQR